MRAYWASGDELVANGNLTPNSLIDPSSGTITNNQAGWPAPSWSSATDPLLASWSLASWSCSDCSSGASSGVNPTLASWSNVGWAIYWG
jgi:hypothetical protein